MKISICVRRAVSGDQQLRPVEIRRGDRRKANLHGPVRKPAFSLHAGRLCRAGGQMRFHSLRVICGRFALFKRNRPGRACGQAIAESVAIILAQQPRLAADHPDRALVARACAQAAAAAFFLIDFYDSPLHFHPSAGYGIIPAARAQLEKPPGCPDGRESVFHGRPAAINSSVISARSRGTPSCAPAAGDRAPAPAFRLRG